MKVAFCLILVISVTASLQGQLCPGSLGDPAAFITFGLGSNAGPALPGTVTNYPHVTKLCPDEGEYTLVNSSFDCFSGDWHVIPADHTPNESRGYFMLVNSASSPGDVYTNTVTGLCANTSYEFAVWVMNISKPTACTGSALEPSITLRVESPSGALLGSFNAGVLPSMQNPIWRQIGVAFSPPPGMTSVVIKIINTAAGGCGNDIAIDDITVSACGPKTTARINSTNSDYIAVCVDAVTSYVLSTNLAPGFSNPVFQWQRSMGYSR